MQASKTLEFLGNIPQPLYKYRRWLDLGSRRQLSRRALTKGEIYLSAADQFNDPFDSTIPLKYDESQLQPDRIFKKLLEVHRQNHPKMSDADLHSLCYEIQQSGRFQNGTYWKDTYEYFKKKFNEENGIFCVTSKKDNLLMWGHYADSHRGFCIGYDKFLLFEHCGRFIGKVKYNKAFPTIDMDDYNWKDISNLFTTKFTDWKYEDEYRLLNMNGPRKVVTLPPQAILEVIIGFKMDDKDKNRIVRLVKRKYPSAKLFESHPNMDKFKMDILPLL